MKNQQRINGFEQIKSFYSWVFNNEDKGINPTHISLYLFLLNQNNRNNWVVWFKVPLDLGMAGAKIGSRNTYYKCLDELQNWKLIKYTKGINNYKSPLIQLLPLKVEHLTEQVTVPLSEQVNDTQTGTQTIQLSEPLPEHIYKLVTSNLELVTKNIGAWVKKELDKKTIPIWEEVLAYFKTQKPYKIELEYALQAKYDTWVGDGWKDGNGNRIDNWKNKVRNQIPFLKPVKIEDTKPQPAAPAFKSMINS